MEKRIWCRVSVLICIAALLFTAVPSCGGEPVWASVSRTEEMKTEEVEVFEEEFSEELSEYILEETEENLVISVPRLEERPEMVKIEDMFQDEITDDLQEETKEDIQEEEQENQPDDVQENTGENVNENIQEKHADFHLSMSADTDEIKAGELLVYTIILENTGDFPLRYLKFTNTFSEEPLEIEWEEAVGLNVNKQTGEVTLDSLGQGEIRTFYLTIDTRETQNLPLTHTCTVSADNPQNDTFVSQDTADNGESVSAAYANEEHLLREVTLTTAIVPLKVEFSVNKTADRSVAFPGDTITYQICIRNTGERTLHSVLTTERFQLKNVYAQFVQKEGVILNGSRTQALISKIEPGTAFGLEAVVTIPEDVSAQELINEVIVITDETGGQSSNAQAEVQVISPGITEIPDKTPTETGSGLPVAQSMAASASTSPKTGDPLKPGVWISVFFIAFFSIIGSFWKKKAKRKH